ncbi:hypothetical protein [endosymbiont DhMRE of Dentiscutata heterogama]|uniref:hypothetical protein n=1 Tax=endosymbiont DhMRE of Dentiscutata heterogama TaxID=1609546 RepID=UPI002AD4C2BC|nr:hypothetical protein [endosymbiont DhMRE of Dentiscutata heterogama]
MNEQKNKPNKEWKKGNNGVFYLDNGDCKCWLFNEDNKCMKCGRDNFEPPEEPNN